MGTEIERKFLIKDDRWKEDCKKCKKSDISQGYLCTDKNKTVRVRVRDHAAKITVKSETVGITRTEFEYSIPLNDGIAMLQMVDGIVISKTRYLFNFKGHTWEIDEFHGSNTGLLVAEIELIHEAEEFACPGWIGREVSDDPRYYNSSLVENPYNKWGK